MRGWLVTLAALTQGCGLLFLPLPGEPWVLADEATEATPDITLLEGDGLMMGQVAPQEPPHTTNPSEPAPSETPGQSTTQPVRPEQPTTLWRGSFMEEIAVVSDTVYGTDGRSLWGIRKGGGSWKVAVLPDTKTDTPPPYAWAVGGGYIWAASKYDTRIMKVRVEGGAFESVQVTEGTPEVMAYSNGYLYWVEMTPDKVLLWRRGNGPAELVTEGDETPSQFAVSGSKVWGVTQTAICEYGTGRPLCEAISEGRPLVVTADPEGYYAALDTDAGVMIWTQGRSLGLVDGNPPRYLAVGNGNVYWGDENGVWAAALDGRGISRAYTTVAQGPLVATREALYWVALTRDDYLVETRSF